jgi:hypothetical protein
MRSKSLVARRAVLKVEPLEDRCLLDATSFVTGLYNDVLRRAPDSAGLASWVARIQAGATNAEVALGFWRSAEHRGLQVDDYYTIYLHRAADPAGRAFWVNMLLSGTLDEVGVQVSFLTSVEYLSAHPTPQLFVAGIFLDVLGRAPNTIEQLNFQGFLLTFGTFTVSFNILNSVEEHLQVIESYYVSFLDRSSDAAGRLTWLAALQTGQATVESVAIGFLASAEYALKN